jgi:hypothetical protein
MMVHIPPSPSFLCSKNSYFNSTLLIKEIIRNGVTD